MIYVILLPTTLSDPEGHFSRCKFWKDENFVKDKIKRAKLLRSIGKVLLSLLKS